MFLPGQKRIGTVAPYEEEQREEKSWSERGRKAPEECLGGAVGSCKIDTYRLPRAVDSLAVRVPCA